MSIKKKKMSNKEFKYTVFKKHKDINQAVLRKYGLHADVTLRDIAASIRQEAKTLSETYSNIALTKALLENIKKHHPFVLKLTEDELKIATIFASKSAELINFEQDLKQLKANIKTYSEELPILNKQIGVTEETVADIALKELKSVKDVAGDTFKKEMKKNGKETK